MSNQVRSDYYVTEARNVRGPRETVSAIKSAVFNASGFILLGAVLLAAFLIAMASASRHLQGTLPGVQ
jgi:hypothetical protein